jgi:hypothetical protein
VGESRDPHSFYFDLQHLKWSSNAKNALLNLYTYSEIEGVAEWFPSSSSVGSVWGPPESLKGRKGRQLLHIFAHSKCWENDRCLQPNVNEAWVAWTHTYIYRFFLWVRGNTSYPHLFLKLKKLNCFYLLYFNTNCNFRISY